MLLLRAAESADEGFPFLGTAGQDGVSRVAALEASVFRYAEGACEHRGLEIGGAYKKVRTAEDFGMVEYFARAALCVACSEGPVGDVEFGALEADSVPQVHYAGAAAKGPEYVGGIGVYEPQAASQGSPQAFGGEEVLRAQAQ